LLLITFRWRGNFTDSPKAIHKFLYFPQIWGFNNNNNNNSLSSIRPLSLFRFRIYFLKLVNLFGHLLGLLGRGISPTQGLYLHRTTQHRKTRTNIHASSGIRTHDPSVRAVEDSTCLRPRGHCDRPKQKANTILELRNSAIKSWSLEGNGYQLQFHGCEGFMVRLCGGCEVQLTADVMQSVTRVRSQLVLRWAYTWPSLCLKNSYTYLVGPNSEVAYTDWRLYQPLDAKFGGGGYDRLPSHPPQFTSHPAFNATYSRLR
jgi:hypothetical protein